MDFFLNSFPGILAAILASYLAAKWSLKGFYAERWLERKERAYVEIIDALYDLVQYCEVQKEDLGGGTRLSPERERELREKYSNAYWKIKKPADIGAFAVSSEAEAVLRELRGRPKLEWESNPRWEIFENDYAYYRHALDDIVRLAKKDLRG